MTIDTNGKNRVVSLLRQEARSRVELAKMTGLVKSALTKITRQLLQDKLIEELPVASAHDKPRQGGRPETRLRLCSGVNHSVCFYISTEIVQCILIDQTNAIIHTLEQPWSQTGTPDAVSGDEFVDLICTLTERICSHKELRPSELKVISVATQGKLAQSTGHVHYSQLITDKNFDLTGAISARTGIPARLFNIAYCSARRIQSRHPEHESFIAILLGYGLGVGIAIDKGIVLGPHGTAPEISHITYSDTGHPCYCGARGCAETYVTYHAIFREISLRTGVAVPGQDVQSKLRYIADELENRNEIFLDVVRQCGRVLGFVLSSLVSTFDIKTIVINGEVSVLYRVLIEEIERYLNSNSDYRFGGGAITFLREPDDRVAYTGLLELTNESYTI